MIVIAIDQPLEYGIQKRLAEEDLAVSSGV